MCMKLSEKGIMVCARLVFIFRTGKQIGLKMWLRLFNWHDKPVLMERNFPYCSRKLLISRVGGQYSIIIRCAPHAEPD